MPTLSIKAWIGIALVTVALVVFGILKYQDGKIDTLNKENGSATVVIGAQAAAIEHKVEASKIDDKAVTNFVEKAQVVTEKTNTRIKVTEEKVKEVKATFDKLPDSVENVQAEKIEIRRVRITSLWDAYCSAKPGAEGCPVATPVTPVTTDPISEIDHETIQYPAT